jgi:hypothetical protein
MPTTSQRVAAQQKLAFTFYWIGVIMSVLCIGLAFARNTELVSNLPSAGFPLSWAAGAIAILAFLVAEYGHRVVMAKDPVARRFSEEPIEDTSWETELADV